MRIGHYFKHHMKELEGGKHATITQSEIEYVINLNYLIFFKIININWSYHNSRAFLIVNMLLDLWCMHNMIHVKSLGSTQKIW